MPHIRIVDYVGNLGGGQRFVIELMRELLESPGYSFDFVSGGQPWLNYMDAFAQANFSLRVFRDDATAYSVSGGAPFPLPEIIGNGADLIWLPWVHRHHIPDALLAKTVVTLHDLILVRHRDHIGSLLDEGSRQVVAEISAAEVANTRRLMDRGTPIILTSHNTQNDLLHAFGRAGQTNLVPLPGAHKLLADAAAPPSGLPDRFMICPATIFPHKNQATLISALGRWPGRLPLVLTGQGTANLSGATIGYPGHINAAVVRSGLVWGKDVVGMGILSSEAYLATLRRASLLVMPTLGEGGGSFPVAEALTLGIPVACSDIPIMREHLSRINGTAVWFNPNDPDDIAHKLAEAADQIEDLKAAAQVTRDRLTDTSWPEVARRYTAIFDHRLAEIRRAPPTLPATARFYGQFVPPQDELLFRRYFSDQGSAPGHFIECGAFDGVSESSCLFFEQTLGWTGINVEPVPDVYDRLCANRPRAVNIRAALSDCDSRALFRHAIHPRHGRHFGNGSLHHTESHLSDLMSQGCQLETFEVATITYRTLLERHPLPGIDLFVLDVEGQEEAVIEGMTGAPILPRVLCIEYGNTDIWSIARRLAAMGYKHDGLIHNNALFVLDKASS